MQNTLSQKLSVSQLRGAVHLITVICDELTDEIMGHDTRKPKYGDGHGLRLKLKYIGLIALAHGMARYPERTVSLVKSSGSV